MIAKTYRLFDLDSHLYSFYARVLAKESDEKGCYIILDKTAFFPEGGGQPADVGTIDGIEVVDVQEKDGVIYHYIRTPIEIGKTVYGQLNEKIRFNRMQNHSGEHILSGLAHNQFGCNNVGFHLTDTLVTLDLDKELSRAQLDDLEEKANEIITRNIRIAAYYPAAEILKTLNYRSKLNLTDNVRIVTIEGVDCCACCAPHVSRTGEIGMLKILDAIHYKGGSRIEMVCGHAALNNYKYRYFQDYEISKMLSSPQENLTQAVSKQLEQLASATTEMTAIKKDYISLLVQNYKCQSNHLNENIFVKLPFADSLALRNLVNELTPLTDGIVCAILPSSQTSFQYIIGCTKGGLRNLIKVLNQQLNGKGGGSEIMVQGTFSTTEAEIEKAIMEAKNESVSR